LFFKSFYYNNNKSNKKGQKMNEVKKTTKLVIDIDTELKNLFKKLSKLEDMDQSKIVRKWIKDYVEQNKDKLNKLF
jgi:hypothetical protein